LIPDLTGVVTPSAGRSKSGAVVIGCGRAGSRFFRAARHLERADRSIATVGMCDADVALAAALGPDLPAFSDPAAALRAVDPDVVDTRDSTASPTGQT